MSLSAICRALGVGIFFLAIAMLAPMAVAIFQADEPIGPYLFALILTAFSAGLLVVLGGGARERQVDVREAMAFVFLWWTLAPIFGAAPFVLAGAPAADAYFEAVSALSTTGAWLSESDARATMSGVLWRSSMQWIGGLASLTIAAAIFIQPIFVGVQTPATPFARSEDGSYFGAMAGALRYFAIPYMAMTALCFVALTAAGEPALPAFATALSVTASGGFYAGASLETSEPALTLAIAGMTLPFVFFSGASFALLSAMGRGRMERARDLETGAYAVIVLTFGVLLWITADTTNVNEGPAFLQQFFNAASLMSTNGVTIGAAPSLAISLVAVIIGGSALSTAGGLKIIRWLVLFRRVREEISRLITPRAVFGRSFVSDEFGVWIHFLAFTFAIAALTLALTAGGQGFAVSAAAAAGVLSNAGPVLFLAAEGAPGYEIFEGTIFRLVLVVGMILGRIETVAALVLFNRAFWRS
ncbi:MAG: potassium transporter TrkG [Pseudomonadota bacterium]